MGDRWVTFDCFGTIVDWNAALGDALVSVFEGESRAQLMKILASARPHAARVSATHRRTMARGLRVIRQRPQREHKGARR